MRTDVLEQAARQVAVKLARRGWMLATAESCTGGLVSAAVTSVARASDWFDRGFVTYSNAAKSDLLGVNPELFAQVGAVSPEVAGAMALGARQRAGVEVAVAISGIAGPGGGTAEKPVGTVWFGLAWKEGDAVQSETRHALFKGDRDSVRLQAAEFALRWLLQAAQPS